jgi:hypothetical protein
MKKTLLWAVLPLAALAAEANAAQPCVRPIAGRPYGPAGPTIGEWCKEGYYQNSIWPKQYIAPSRRGICQSYEAMINNGWRRHNLLGKHHFNPQTGELTESGRLKVEWILTQAPPSQRTIFIERIADVAKSEARMQSVQALAADLSLEASAPQIRETYVRDHGHPASTVDAVFTGFSANQMIPALPQSTTAGGSAGAAPAP